MSVSEQDHRISTSFSTLESGNVIKSFIFFFFFFLTIPIETDIAFVQHQAILVVICKRIGLFFCIFDIYEVLVSRPESRFLTRQLSGQKSEKTLSN